MHPEILCDIEIGPAERCECTQERQIGHVLHGREKESRAVDGDHGGGIPRLEREPCPV